MKLPDGTLVKIRLKSAVRQTQRVQEALKPDSAQAYGQLTLELGLLFKNFTECIKVPNRERMIRTLKLMMIVLKSDNNLSKYSDEILRFLVHQLCLLSEKEAHCMFYCMFVNTKGRLDSHIPVDLQMEFIVRVCKKNIKHMHSNKTEGNIQRKTSVLAAINMLVQNFDQVTGVIKRTSTHSTASAFGDEVSMIQDLRELQPFTYQSGRCLDKFPHLSFSMLSKLNYDHFFSWLMRRKEIHALSLGN